MIKVREGDYAYASGRIRAIEPKLLGPAHYARMLDANDAQEAFRVLTDSGYGYGGSGSAGIFAFEGLLSEEMKKTYALLVEIFPQIEIVKAFRRKYDYFNIKVLLKAEYSGVEIPPILADTGTVGSEDLKRMIRERDYEGLTLLMVQTIEEVRDIFSRTQDPQVIDLLLDRTSYRQLASDIGNIDSPYLQEIAQIIIDSTNIKMYMRTMLLGKPADFIRKLLLEGGSIPEGLYMEYGEKSIDAFVDAFTEKFSGSRYVEAIRKGWESCKTKESSSLLEKLLDDLLMIHIRKARAVTIGVEPVIAFLFAKETEIINIRIIMTGRINRLPAEMIRERLREGYV